MSGHSRLRHSLRLSIEAPPPSSEFAKVKPVNITPDSNSPGSTAGSLSTDSTGSSAASNGPDWKICSVICLHDYSSDDPSHLSFSKNEILDILQQEDTGWWAARSGSRVGWISSAYVDILSPELAKRLQKLPEHLRESEYEVETQQSTDPVIVSDSPEVFHPSLEVAESEKTDIWVPNIEQTPATPANQAQFLTVPDTTHLSSVHQSQSPPESQLIEGITEGWSPRDREHQSPRIRDLQTGQHSPLGRSKSLSSNVLSPSPSSGEYHTRSFSETLPLPRQRRRRPMLLDDSSSLSRLSTLIESHNSAEIDVLAHTPMENLDAFSRISVRPSSPGESSPEISGSLTRSQTNPSPSFSRTEKNSARRASSWFMRPAYDDNHMMLDYDGTIKAGTLPALVERLTLDYLKPSKEERFRQAFLRTYRTFATAQQVFDLLLDQYQVESPPNLSSQEFTQWKENKLKPTRNRVLTIFTMWMEDHNMVREEPQVARKLQDFLSLVIEGDPLALTAKLMLQSLARLQQTSNGPMPVTPITPASTPKRWRQRFANPELVKLDVTEVAQQLCLLEHKLYAKILVQDCWAWRRTKNPLAEFCSTHEKLVNWVKTSLTEADSSRKKADVIDFWIHCAEKCKSMNNVSSMNAIVTALTGKSVQLPDNVWSHVHRKAHLDSMSQLGDPANNFGAYRKLLQNIEAPCVPFIGMYLVEIVDIHNEYPDTVTLHTGTPLINFVKRQKWAAVINNILRFQSKSYSFAEVQTVGSFIDAHLVPGETESRHSHSRSRDQSLDVAEWSR